MALSEQQSIGFTSNNGRRISGKFDGGAISSDGGLMPLREAHRKLRLTESVAKLFDDSRQAGKVKHEIETMIRQRTYGMCTGDPDLNDFEQLRHDPLWKTA